MKLGVFFNARKFDHIKLLCFILILPNIQRLLHLLLQPAMLEAMFKIDYYQILF